jgi:3-oxoacyl-[acyl-carrier protein] reductase
MTAGNRTTTDSGGPIVELPSFFRLDGQVAVVTGGASGIGEATSRVLAEAGASIVVADIDEDGAARTAKEITAAGGAAVAMRTNVSQKADVDALVQRAVDEFDQVDIMCNVAGVGAQQLVVDVTEEELDRILSVNLKGVFFGCQAAMRVMARRQSGVIVNVSSTVIDTPFAGFSVYGMTKSAVAFLSMTLAAEAAPLGIRVNAIAPGSTMTNFASYRLGDEQGTVDPEVLAEFAESMRQMTPLGRNGVAMDQALLILYLVTPASSWATGNLWRVNGGMTRPW